MGKRGPKPKPTLIKLLEGNPGRRPINYSEPICDIPARKPEFVAADRLASAEWDRIVRSMPPSMYTELDVGILATHAVAVSMMQKAQVEIDRFGVTLTSAITDPGIRKVPTLRSEVNPAVKVWKTATETLIKTADRLGLHPAARSRLELSGHDTKPEIPSRFAGLLGVEQPH